jgi:hypothetical protein
LVRKHAPQLLDPVSTDEPASWISPDLAGEAPEHEVIEYRARDAKVAPPLTANPQPPARPVRLNRAPENILAGKPASKRSAQTRALRLDQVSARSPDGESITAHPAIFDGEQAGLLPKVRSLDGDLEPIEQAVRSVEAGLDAAQIEPPIVRTSVPADEPGRKRSRPSLLARFSRAKRLAQGGQVGATAQSTNVVAQREGEMIDLPPQRHGDMIDPTIREVLTQAAPTTNVRFPETAAIFERQNIRETTTSLPHGADVPTIRTGTGQAPRLHQQRTNVPYVAAQTVFRPPLTAAPLNLEDVKPDRWPSLPDEAAEAPGDSSIELQRHERLKREQEGRAWSE